MGSQLRLGTGTTIGTSSSQKSTKTVDDQDPNTVPKIILFGDSLTEWSFFPEEYGFGAALTSYYFGTAHVMNRGFAGYSTRMAKKHFFEIVEEVKRSPGPAPLFITIFFGANDACFSAPWVHVPLEEYENHLRIYVDTILKAPSFQGTKIILITPPPINIKAQNADLTDVDSSQQEQKETIRYRTYMSKKTYAEKVMEIAKSYKDAADRVAGLNFWRLLVCDALERGQSLDLDSDDFAFDEDTLPGSGLPTAKEFSKGVFTDGLHLGRLGYDVLNKALLSLLEEKWPELRPEKLQSADA